VFLGVEVAFFSASLTKVVHGGWIPLVMGLASFIVLTTWRRGHELVMENRTRKEGSLRDFVRKLRALEPPVAGVAGTAVFLNANPQTTPLALRANVERNHVLHESVVMMSVETERAAHVGVGDRLAIDDLGDVHDGLVRLSARFGFHDEPRCPRRCAWRSVRVCSSASSIATTSPTSSPASPSCAPKLPG
jgi:KUP system potassium uptake protein